VKFDRSRVEAPEVEVALISRPGQPSYGAGEAAATPVAAVLGNAIFDATGVRLCTVPFRWLGD
jgi:CO/xanthine dehydrogenase Mo-binding subunit